MSPREKIVKSQRACVENIKDTTTRNIAQAITNKHLKVEAKSVQLLLDLIGASIEEGADRAHKSFQKTVDAVLAEAADDIRVEFDMAEFGSKKN